MCDDTDVYFITIITYHYDLFILFLNTMDWISVRFIEIYNCVLIIYG